jgi:hypothetical protein
MTTMMMIWEHEAPISWLLLWALLFLVTSIHKWEGFSDRDEESEVAFGRPSFNIHIAISMGFLLFAFVLYFLLVYFFPSLPRLLLNWFSLGLSFFSYCTLSPFVFSCVTTIRDIVTYHIFALGILFCNSLFYFTCRHIHVRVFKCNSSCAFYCFSCFRILGLYKGSASTNAASKLRRKTWREIQREYIRFYHLLLKGAFFSNSLVKDLITPRN